MGVLTTIALGIGINIASKKIAEISEYLKIFHCSRKTIKEIKDAFEDALQSWSKHDISPIKLRELDEFIKDYYKQCENPTAISDAPKEFQKFLELFELALSKRHSAFNYLNSKRNENHFKSLISNQKVLIYGVEELKVISSETYEEVKELRLEANTKLDKIYSIVHGEEDILIYDREDATTRLDFFIPNIKSTENRLDREIRRSNRAYNLNFINIDLQEKSMSLNDELMSSDHKLIVLEGDPGIGKSIELSYVAKNLWESTQTDIIPFFRDLRNFTYQDKIEDFLQIKETEKFVNVLYILDGIDEIKDPSNFISKLNIYIVNRRNKTSRFLISCRSNILKRLVHEIEDAQVFEILNLTDNQSIELFKKIANTELKTAEIHELSNSEFLGDPFRIKLLADLYKEHGIIEKDESKLWNYYIKSSLEIDEEKFTKKRPFIPQIEEDSEICATVHELMNQFFMERKFLYKIVDRVQSRLDQFVDCSLVDKEIGENKFYFKHRKVQECLTSNFLSRLEIDQIQEICNIPYSKIIKPQLENTILLLISNVSDHKKKNSLLNWIKSHNSDLIFKADLNLFKEDERTELFQDYFNTQCIHKSLWIGGNSSISETDLVQFSDSIQAFNFLVEVIKNKKLNRRARLSSVNLLQHFTSVNQETLMQTIMDVLSSDEDISFKSRVIRLLNLLSENTKIKLLNSIIVSNKDESNKEWNRSILSILSELNNIDEFFDYLKREFNWANKLVKRDEIDETHRGNSWMVMDLVLRLNEETNFLELVPYYLNDYNLKTDITFRDNLIEKCIKFEDESPGFIIKILKKIKKDDKIESLYNDEVLSVLIKKTENELEAFKVIFDDANSNTIDSLFLAKITTKETIDYFIKTFNLSNDHRIKLQVYRNLISSYGNRDLAFYLEEKLIEQGIDIGEKMFSKEESIKINKQIEEEVQKNTDLLFDDNKLILKVKSTIPKENLNNINFQVINKIERLHFDVKGNWFRGLGSQFDVLYACVKLYPNLSLPKIKKILQESKQIQIVALKEMLEYNKTAQYKFELSCKQIESIKTWLKKESQAFNFKDLVQFNSHTGFTIKRMSDYKLLKTLFYFVDIDDFQDSFDESFILDSIVYYRMEESSPFSESFEKLLEKIEDKEKLKQKIISSIKSNVFSFTMDRLIVHALKNKYSEVYPEIEEFLEMSIHSPGEKIFDLYIDETKNWKLIKKIANDLNDYKGWGALKELSQLESEKSFCTKKCLNYLSGDISEFKSNALAILFKLNHQKALDYFIKGIDMNPLYNIAVKYRTEYTVPTELFIEKFNELFVRIYETKEDKDDFDRDWELTENNTFFTQLITNVLKNSKDISQTFHQLSQKLKDVQVSSKDDRIIFFANSINENLKNNYISLMSVPLSFEEAKAITDRIVK